MTESTLSESLATTYRKRDSGELSYEVRELLQEYGRVELWASENQLLAVAEDDA